MSRKYAALRRRVARLAAEWVDPMMSCLGLKEILCKNIEVAEDGEVAINSKA